MALASDDLQDGMTTLSTLIARVESFEDASYQARQLAERDRDYYDNKQLTEQEQETLRKRGQPPIVFNRIQRKVDFLTGLEKSKRVDPKAFPRTPQDQEAADAATDALRYIARNNDFDQVRSNVWENMLIEGAGGAEVTVKPKSYRNKMMQGTAYQQAERDFEDFEVTVWWYPWDRIGWDPASRRSDFSDANYKFCVIWKDLEEAKAKWPEPEDPGAFDFATMHGGDDTTTFDDRPQRTFWVYPERRRIKVIMMYYRDYQEGWSWCLFTKAGVVARGVSPFLDENGDPECPLELVSAYTDRENNRYGIVRAMVSPQDEINKRRSKLLHMLTMRQVVADHSAVQDERRAKSELSKADGYISVTPGARFEVLPNGDQATGQFNLLDQSMQEMDLMGPNASMTGKGPQDQSGRAILAQQQGGNTEIATLEDRLRNWTLRMYRQMWRRVQQYWTEQRWVRVTDNEQNVKFVGLNQPVTAGEVFSQELQQSGMDEQTMQAELAAAQQDPRFNAVIDTRNNVAELDVDITLDEAPDTPTIQHEQFDKMVQLVQAGVPIPPDVLIQMFPGLRNRREILDRLSGGDDPQAQQQAQMQQEAAMAEVRKVIAEAAKAEADAQKTAAEVPNTMAEAAKTQAETYGTYASAAKDEAAALAEMAGVDRDDADLVLRAQREAEQARQAQQQQNTGRGQSGASSR